MKISEKEQRCILESSKTVNNSCDISFLAALNVFSLWLRLWVIAELFFRTYVLPLIHVSRCEILHFKHTRVLTINGVATPGRLEIKKKNNNNNNKADSFFRLHFNVYIDLDNCEKELEWEIKNKGVRPISLEERHANFIAVVKKIKWEMLSATKVKMSDSEKKVNRNNYNIFSIMYNYDVSGRFRCGRAKQRQKKCLHVKVSVFVY